MLSGNWQVFKLTRITVNSSHSLKNHSRHQVQRVNYNILHFQLKQKETQAMITMMHMMTIMMTIQVKYCYVYLYFPNGPNVTSQYALSGFAYCHLHPLSIDKASVRTWITTYHDWAPWFKTPERPNCALHCSVFFTWPNYFVCNWYKALHTHLSSRISFNIYLNGVYRLFMADISQPFDVCDTLSWPPLILKQWTLMYSPYYLYTYCVKSLMNRHVLNALDPVTSIKAIEYIFPSSYLR